MAQEGRVPLPPCPAGPQAAASVRHRPLFLATPLRGGLLLKAERARGRRGNVQSPWTWVGFAHPPPPARPNISVVWLGLGSTPAYPCARSAAAGDRKAGMHREGHVSGWGEGRLCKAPGFVKDEELPLQPCPAEATGLLGSEPKQGPVLSSKLSAKDTSEFYVRREIVLFEILFQAQGSLYTKGQPGGLQEGVDPGMQEAFFIVVTMLTVTAAPHRLPPLGQPVSLCELLPSSRPPRKVCVFSFLYRRKWSL